VDVWVGDEADVDRGGAQLVIDWLADSRRSGRREPTVMPALGRSALGLYRELGAARAEGRLDASGIRLVQLDEYLGLETGDRRSLLGWLRRDVAAPLAVGDDAIIGWSLERDDPVTAAASYDAAVAEAGGIDIAILGLGPNGHLGFNEPPSGPDAPSRSVVLTDASLDSNAAYWGSRENVPTEAMTAGMGTILAARRVLLVVHGEAKRPILARLLDERVSAELPASFIRDHPAATILADLDAWGQERPRPSPAAVWPVASR
jgi:glucosamine-6-phosphate deaminase